MSRRQFLVGAGALGVGAALSSSLAACSSPSEKRLSFLNWQDYIDPTILEDFTRSTGIAVGYETYASNDAPAERLAAADVSRKGGRKTTTFDLIVPSTNLFRSLREADSLQPLDTQIVTEALLANLEPEFRAMDVDPGNRDSVPWATGSTAIGYDSSVFTEPPTWEVFLDARYAGRMSLLDERREAFAAALISLGEDPNTRDVAVIAEAEARLTEMARSSAFNSATYLDDLATNKVVVAHALSTDVLQARKRNPQLAFTIPAAGATRWVDLLCVPTDAPHAVAANTMIAFYLDPKVSATNAAYNLVATGNLKASDFVPQAVLDDPAVYPPDDVVATLTFLMDLGETEKVYDEAWTRVKG